MTEREWLVALSSFPQFGAVRIKLLLKYFGSAEKVWNTDLNSLLETKLGFRLANAFIRHRLVFDSENYFKKLKKFSVNYCLIDDPEYPLNLKEIEQPPPILYYKGVLKKVHDTNSIAIVGTRNMSEYGKRAAYQLSFGLSELGFTIVSGLALGIDAVAHKACIDARGRGIVVLASGVDIISPYTNKWVAEKIISTGGVIISEFPLGTPPTRTSFPLRNRIVSGLSKGVVVIEARKKSGTMHTVNAAADQGRAVFAVPGSIFSSNSEAPHFLIQNGAKLVSNINDIAEELMLHK